MKRIYKITQMAIQCSRSVAQYVSTVLHSLRIRVTVMWRLLIFETRVTRKICLCRICVHCSCLPSFPVSCSPACLVISLLSVIKKYDVWRTSFNSRSGIRLLNNRSGIQLLNNRSGGLFWNKHSPFIGSLARLSYTRS